MNRMEKALLELEEMDELADRRSPLHSLHALSKLFVTTGYILLVVSFHKYDLMGLIPMILYPVLLFQIGSIPLCTCFFKLRYVLPLVMAVGLFNPFLDRVPLLYVGTHPVSGGIVSMLTLMLKGILALMASFLLMATTPMDELCAGLRKIHVPGVLVTLLLLTYRYVGVLTEEASNMTDAYRLRAPGQRGVHVSAWGSFLGQLLLRSADRAQELYESMQLRGFGGDFRYVGGKAFGWGDVLFLLLSAVSLGAIRIFPVAKLLGSLLVR